MNSVRTTIADSQSAGKLCAVCQTELLAGERIAVCPSCAQPYHAECWTENGGCAQYGCPSAPEIVKAAPAANVVEDTWNKDKRCPSCAKTIKARALKCRFCGVLFDTREQMTSLDFLHREYTDKEVTKARNLVVLLFFLSATGCLTPIMLVVTAIFVFHGKLGGLEYRRLPPALRALAMSAFAVCCLLTAALVLIVLIDGL